MKKENAYDEMIFNIPSQVVYQIKKDKYVIPAYVFLRFRMNGFRHVLFDLTNYYSFMGEKGRKTTVKRRDEYNHALISVINQFATDENDLLFYERNTDIRKKRQNNLIAFTCKDSYMSVNNNVKGFCMIDMNIIATIQDYYKNRRLNLFGKTLSLYVYLMMCMSYPKTRNDDGSYHYSNNPVYYTSFKKKLMESVNMTETELENGIKHLVDMKLIKTYYPGSYNGTAKISGGVDLNISVFGLPTVYVPVICPQVRNFDCDDNFNEALKKICKDNGYSFKRYTQKLREES